MILCLTDIKISKDSQEDILINDVVILDGEKYREVLEVITEGVYSVVRAMYGYDGTDIEALMVDNRVYGENADITEFDRKGNKMNVSYKSGENAFLEFLVFAYPYYQCEDVQTGEKFSVEKGTINNRIRIL